MDYFVTATDTDAGKTYFIELVLKAFCAKQLQAIGYKPIASGTREDSRRIQQACHTDISLEQINPICLKTPISPRSAAEIENKQYTLDELVEGYWNLKHQFPIVLVEGVGGWRVPLAPSWGIPELAQALKLPVIVVVNNRIGAINHTQLTVDAILASGLEVKGIVLNQPVDEPDLACISNRQEFIDSLPVPILTEIIHDQRDLTSDEWFAQ